MSCDKKVFIQLVPESVEKHAVKTKNVNNDVNDVDVYDYYDHEEEGDSSGHLGSNPGPPYMFSVLKAPDVVSISSSRPASVQHLKTVEQHPRDFSSDKNSLRPPQGPILLKSILL